MNDEPMFNIRLKLCGDDLAYMEEKNVPRDRATEIVGQFFWQMMGVPSRFSGDLAKLHIQKVETGEADRLYGRIETDISLLVEKA